MFDQANGYHGGVNLSDTAVEVPTPAIVADIAGSTGDGNPATSGNDAPEPYIDEVSVTELAARTQAVLTSNEPDGMSGFTGVPAAKAEELSHGSGVAALPQASSPQMFLRAAESEAAQLVEEARSEAKNLREAIIAEARAEADEIRAKALTEASSIFGSDLWSSRHALSIIVGEALEHMIGTIGEEEATVKAVEHAILEFCKDKQVALRAEKDTANRLRLALLSRQKELNVPMLKIVDDEQLAKGRCIVSAENQTFEVSVKGQIQTINNVAREAVAAAIISADRDED